MQQRHALGLLFLFLTAVSRAHCARAASRAGVWVIAVAAAALGGWLARSRWAVCADARRNRSNRRSGVFSACGDARRHERALAGVPAARATARYRDRLILTYAPLVKFVAGRLGSGPPRARRRGRSRLLRPARPDRGHRALRPRPRDQVRDLRDLADQGRDHRRAARAGLGAALRPRARPRHRARDRGARDEARTARPPTRRSRRSSACPEDELDGSLTEISRSSIAALDELWTVSAGGDQVALIDTIEDTQGPEPQAALAQSEMQEALGESIARLPEREKLVVTLYYYEELTLREIGEVLGVTESRVSQLHTKAILRLKARLGGAAAAAETR